MNNKVGGDNNERPQRPAQYRRDDQEKPPSQTHHRQDETSSTPAAAAPETFSQYIEGLSTFKKIAYSLVIALLVIMTTYYYASMNTTKEIPSFINAKDSYQLNEMVRQAKDTNKPVIIYFYAAWCPYCHMVEKNVLRKNSVQKNLKNIVAISVDATTMTQATMGMMDDYNVRGFPTFIVYDQYGEIIEPYQLQGKISAAGMNGALEDIMKPM
tara:strand:- start:201 stop:836 length:636 start_codon:yes stop_codon:yes gene_type:complete